MKKCVRITVDGKQVIIAPTDDTLREYSPGTLYVDEGGGVIAFRPTDHPDRVHVVVDGNQVEVFIGDDGRVYHRPAKNSVLYDVTVDARDRQAAIAASRLSPDHSSSDN